MKRKIKAGPGPRATYNWRLFK